MFTRRKIVTAILLSTLLLHLLAGVALAALVPIDHFNDGAFLTVSDSTGGGDFGFAPGGSALGGERDLFVLRSGGTGTASVTIDPATHYLQFLTTGDSGGGEAILQLDGTDSDLGLAVLNPLVDLSPISSGGTNRGFHIEIVGSNTPVLLTIEVYSNDNNDCSSGSITIPGNIPTTSNVDFFLLFANMSACAGSPANLSAASAVQIILDAPAGTQFRLDFVEASNKRDFGDLPATYDEASHASSIGTRLGANLDTESSSFFSADALGDDTSEVRDDEDGVVPTPGNLWNDGSGSVDVTVNFCTSTCRLGGWVDWNQDGDFNDANERVINIGLSNGTSTQSFLTQGAISGSYAARFRLFEDNSNTDPQPTFDGAGGGSGTFANGGEVEDYYWNFGPTAITLKTLDARSGMAQMALPLSIAAVLCLLALGLVVYLRRRQI